MPPAHQSESIQERIARIEERAINVEDKLDEILVLVKATNGRVGKLELWQAKLSGASWAFSWLPAMLVSVVVVVVNLILA